MENVLLIGLSRQMAASRQMSIIANNLANMNTSGFKAESVLYQEYEMAVAAEETPDKTLSFVQDFGLVRNLTAGRAEVTDNPLDLAINGEGYFKVQSPDGVRYTRNGHFSLDPQGQLVMSNGFPVLTQGGAPLKFDESDTDISITKDGTVSTSQGEKGKLALVEFENPRLLKKDGNGLLETEEPETPVRDPKMVQGSLEKSNVQPIVEMTNMIDVLRSYTGAAKMNEKTDELRRRAISTLGRVNA